MNVVKEIKRINEKEIQLGLSEQSSWHVKYKDSAYIFVGGLDYELTEGDVLTVFSQYGEIVDINLVRDKETGKSKGFCFICYEDQRSTILAVDNFNGAKVAGRILRVDHVAKYRLPKDKDEEKEKDKEGKEEGGRKRERSSERKERSRSHSRDRSPEERERRRDMRKETKPDRRDRDRNYGREKNERDKEYGREDTSDRSKRKRSPSP
jgi:RNA-binding motif X-linked protein 2